MALKIVRYGNPVLREVGKPVTFPLSEGWRRLLQEMLLTMRGVNGVGLAAQQVGYALQLAVIDVRGVEDRPSRLWREGEEVEIEREMPLYLINPEVELTKSKLRESEGCLSFPNLSLMISRSKRVRFKTYDFEGRVVNYEATGLLARAVQHEFDHLQGRLFIDYLSASERSQIKDRLDAIKNGED